MISIRSRLVKFFLVKHLMRKAFDPFETSLEEIRQKSAKMANRVKLPKKAHIEKIKIGGVNAEWLRAAGVNKKQRFLSAGPALMATDETL